MSVWAVGRSSPRRAGGLGLFLLARCAPPALEGCCCLRAAESAQGWGQGAARYGQASAERGALTRYGRFCRTPLPLSARLTRAGLYGGQVFLSFFLMLVFMTYNVSLFLLRLWLPVP